MMTKRCPRCKRVLPLTVRYFFRDKTKKDGFHYRCKKCKNRFLKIYRRKNREKISEKNKIYRQKNREKIRKKTKIHYWKNREKLKIHRGKIKQQVMNHYGGKCVCCKEDKIEFLTIDHVNGDGNKHRRKIKYSGGFGFYLWLVRNNYPNDFPLQLLCWNCNCSKGYYGYCPHERLDK